MKPGQPVIFASLVRIGLGSGENQKKMLIARGPGTGKLALDFEVH
jgi:hypothetical protein